MTEKSRKVNESQIDFLKPCPKCGGRSRRVTNMWDSVVYPDVTPEYCVMCQSCDYEVRSDISMEDAEKEWNRRARE